MQKIQQIGRDLFKFTFSSPKKELMIEPGKRMNLTFYKYDAPEKASQIAMMLRKKIKGKKLINIYQHGNDRVIVLEFNGFNLIVEFFSHGNFVLTDADFNILFTFRKEVWKDRELKKGGVYKFPGNLSLKMKEDFSPVSKSFFEKAGSINRALDEFYSGVKKKNKKLEKLNVRLEKQHETFEEYSEKIKEFNKVGDWIYSKYPLIEKLFKLKDDELQKLGVKRKGKKLVLEIELK